MQLGNGLDVRTRAKKQRMAKRKLPAKAAQNIPGLREQGSVQGHHHKVKRDA